MFANINDYELLYLIGEQNEKARDLMYQKYSFLIRKTISVMNVPPFYQDEFFQEGLMLLMNVITTFDNSYNKTFCRFFELCLKRKFYRLFKDYMIYSSKIVRIEDVEDLSLPFMEEDSVVYQIKPRFDSNIEAKLYFDVVIGNLAPKEFARINGVDIKKVYNLIYKLKKNLKDFK